MRDKAGMRKEKTVTTKYNTSLEVLDDHGSAALRTIITLCGLCTTLTMYLMNDTYLLIIDRPFRRLTNTDMFKCFALAFGQKASAIVPFRLPQLGPRMRERERC